MISQTVIEVMAGVIDGDLAVQRMRRHPSMTTLDGYIGHLSQRRTSGAPVSPIPKGSEWIPYGKDDDLDWLANAGQILATVGASPDALQGPAADDVRTITEDAMQLLQATKANAKQLLRLDKTQRKELPQAKPIREGPIGICSSLEGGACGGVGLTECVLGCHRQAHMPKHRAHIVLTYRRDLLRWGSATHPLVGPRTDYLTATMANEMAMSDDDLLVLLADAYTDEDRDFWLDQLRARYTDMEDAA